ncbi:spore coat protein A, manganese oxidase [Marchantia polymorpha subsp. ruderalis]|uniref:Plastocyanin-like domain-containing protein n=1 Tax=Marchantia polymorpha TaxID=3197 RepID=A0A2R6W1J5_MARPO|nr:hypothetical protein MARPO_0186s0019 [Marchantia polymorpha]BBN18699.1 hypothetical protein Mp_8g04700 [Marchantia polymorpha subsp. ruderalis]|eukprot:PTQ27720.1 hypothetical protein MARPO_0186s0019 [Marchantia polymorpha]
MERMAVLVLALCWLGLLLSPGTKAAEDDHMPHDNNQTTDGVQSLCQALDPSPQVQPFVEELTQPPVIDISTGQQLTLGVYKIKQKFHPDLPETTLYAYGTSQETASTPGPTLLATRGIESYVRWENHLNDSEHFLTVDHSIHWANPKSGGVPIVTHLHGGEVLSESDGYPDAWYTSAGELGPAFTTQNYTYANSQPAALLWYHDHTVGITRLNMLAGMNGMYLIKSPGEEPENLPAGEFERLIVVQDKQFHADGAVNFPTVGVSPGVHPNWCPEYYGDTIILNGKAWPVMTVYPTMYRFRMVNAANARYFVMTLSDPKLRFYQIGTDGGYLHKRMKLTTLTMGPAERLDFLIDFSKVTPGSVAYLNNSGNAPYPDGDPAVGLATVMMKFNVVAAPENVTVPQFDLPASQVLGPRVRISTEGAVVRSMTLSEYDDGNDNPTGSLLNGLRWRDPLTETPELNATEVWEIINLTEDAHPIHLHLISFRVKSQQAFDAVRQANYNCSFFVPFPDPQSCFTEAPQKPELHHRGWKDTATVYPGKVTVFVVRWATQSGEQFSFDATSGPGYVWHCHILDHEDNDMMRPLKMMAANSSQLP